jgi:hypothetical protein
MDRHTHQRAKRNAQLLAASLLTLGLGVPLLTVPTAAATPLAAAHALHEAANSISCVSSTVCFAAGSYGNPPKGEIAKVVDGARISYQTISTVSSLGAISCAGMAGCEVIGYKAPKFVAIKISASGVLGPEVPLPQSFSAISCAGAALTCYAAGGEGTEVSVTRIKSGAAGPVHVVNFTTRSGGLDSAAISCWAPTACEVAMDFSTGTAFLGYVLAVSAGTPGTAALVSSKYGIDGIACPAPATCTVAGTSEPGMAMVAKVDSGKISAVHPVAKATELTSVACSAMAACTAVGSTAYGENGGKSIVISVSGGLPGTGTIVSAAAVLNAVASTAGTSYEAVGPVSFGLNSGDDILAVG